jgi:hypothetical protein
MWQPDALFISFVYRCIITIANNKPQPSKAQQLPRYHPSSNSIATLLPRPQDAQLPQQSLLYSASLCDLLSVVESSEILCQRSPSARICQYCLRRWTVCLRWTTSRGILSLIISSSIKWSTPGARIKQGCTYRWPLRKHWPCF